jgi:hypothetical protein
MKFQLRGRALQIALSFGDEQIIASLRNVGFSPERAEAVAVAAKKFADEETAELTRQLIPKSAWRGVVIIKRHLVAPRDETWLMLKYQEEAGWHLDSALFA